MVAGMVMTSADLMAIYELLFRNGVIVVKKDKRPRSMHPEMKEVNNLKVLCSMGSLKSRGYVRETFIWKHAYYFLTNKGIVYLRDYLHLPPEISPATAAQVQPGKGPTSHSSTQRAGGKTQESPMDRRMYRHRRAEGELEESESSRPCGRRRIQSSSFSNSSKEGRRSRCGASCPPTDDRTIRCSNSDQNPRASPALRSHKEMQSVPMAPSLSVREDSPCDAKMLKQLDVEVLNASHESRSEHHLTAPLSTAFTGASEEKVVTFRFADTTFTQKVTEKTDPDPVAPSEASSAALEIPLPPADWESVTEDPEKEREVQRSGPDVLEGLSFVHLLLLFPLTYHGVAMGTDSVWEGESGII